MKVTANRADFDELMSTPQEVRWERDPHTAAKHQMLRGYLMAWFPIVSAAFKESGLTYVDAFAGPGEYTNSDESSPVIAVTQAMRGDVIKHGARQRILLIEEDPRRHKNLVTVMNSRFPERNRPLSLDLKVVQGDCLSEMIPQLQKMKAIDGPVFVNFDGWGVDTPASLVRHVGRMNSAEVLITFQTSHFVRFGKLENQTAGDRVFGGTGWRDIAIQGSPQEKKGGLVDAYRDTLRAAGFPFVLKFELVGKGGHELLLVFGTSRREGLRKMKDAMWGVDSVHGQRFRDPKDTNQLTLDIEEEPDLSLLERQLLAEVERIGETTLATLKEHTLLESIFRMPHATKAVERLREEGRLECEPAHSHEKYVVRLAPLTLF